MVELHWVSSVNQVDKTSPKKILTSECFNERNCLTKDILQKESQCIIITQNLGKVYLIWQGGDEDIEGGLWHPKGGLWKNLGGSENLYTLNPKGGGS